MIAYAAERSRQAAEHDLIVVAPPTGRPRRVLDLVGAARFVRIVDDLQTALGASPSPAPRAQPDTPAIRGRGAAGLSRSLYAAPLLARNPQRASSMFRATR